MVKFGFIFRIRCPHNARATCFYVTFFPRRKKVTKESPLKGGTHGAPLRIPLLGCAAHRTAIRPIARLCRGQTGGRLGVGATSEARPCLCSSPDHLLKSKKSPLGQGVCSILVQGGICDMHKKGMGEKHRFQPSRRSLRGRGGLSGIRNEDAQSGFAAAPTAVKSRS